jgi:hypothetical protein
MDADAMVVWFIGNIAVLRSRLLAEFSDVLGLVDLIIKAQQGEIPRRGTVGELGYSIHGVGCRIEDNSGAIVDVDIARDGATEIFNPWRVRMCYQYSMGVETSVCDSEIMSACRRLASSGVLRDSKPGWFSVVSR